MKLSWAVSFQIVYIDKVKRNILLCLLASLLSPFEEKGFVEEKIRGRV